MQMQDWNCCLIRIVADVTELGLCRLPLHTRKIPLPEVPPAVSLTGKDGSIAEYELEKLSVARWLCLQSLHTLGGVSAVTAGPSPTALAFAPPLPYFAQSSADTLLLVADEAHKLRLYNADTHTCVATAVGPLHGGPLTNCRVFRWV